MGRGPLPLIQIEKQKEALIFMGRLVAIKTTRILLILQWNLLSIYKELAINIQRYQYTRVNTIVKVIINHYTNTLDPYLFISATMYV